MTKDSHFVASVSRIFRSIRNQQIQRWLFFVFFSVSTIGVLGYLLFREREMLQNFHWKINLTPFLLSIPLYLLTLLIAAWVWGWMVNTLAIQLPYKKHFVYFSLANVTKRLPGTIWYIIGRAYLYREDGIDMGLTSVISGVDLLISLISSLIISLIFTIVVVKEKFLNPYLIGSIIILICLIMHPSFYRWICNRLKLDTGQLTYRMVMMWSSASLFRWFASGSLLFAVANIFTDVPYRHLCFFIGSFATISTINMLTTFLPSNFGVTEVGLSLLLSEVLPGYIAVIVAVSFRLLITIFDVIVASICWKIAPRISKRMTIAEAELTQK